MTKRFVSLMLALLLLMAAAIPTALAGDEDYDPRAGYYYVKTENGKGLNVRDRINGSVVGVLKYGTRIYVDSFTTPE